MIEQIARAIIDDLVRVTPLSGSSMTYNAETGCVDFEGAFRPAEIAQAILPLIEAAVLTERERCAGVAEWINPASTDYQRGRSDAAAKIRSQP